MVSFFKKSHDGTALLPHPVLPLLIFPLHALLRFSSTAPGILKSLQTRGIIQHYLIIQITSYSEDLCANWALVWRFQKLFF